MTEILTCPSCQRKLQVPEQFLGETVQCPECRHMFTATSTAVSTTPTTAPPASVGGAAPAKKPRYEEDDYDVPRRRRRFEDDDDFDDEYDVRRGGRPRRQHHDAHRGGIILALGLISLVGGLSICLPVLVGPVAWAMGSYDLREMREGRMDPSGESMTRTGQVLGIIATVLLILGAGFLFLVIANDF